MSKSNLQWSGQKLKESEQAAASNGLATPIEGKDTLETKSPVRLSSQQST